MIRIKISIAITKVKNERRVKLIESLIRALKSTSLPWATWKVHFVLQTQNEVTHGTSNDDKLTDLLINLDLTI